MIVMPLTAMESRSCLYLSVLQHLKLKDQIFNFSRVTPELLRSEFVHKALGKEDVYPRENNFISDKLGMQIYLAAFASLYYNLTFN